MATATCGVDTGVAPDGGAGDGASPPGDGGATPDGDPGALLTYQRVQQKSSHNSYQRHEALLDQLIYHRVRSLELDVHHSKGSADVPGDWYVYHVYLLDDGTTCQKLSDCLAEMRAFHNAVPEHEVVTLWIDLKDPFNATHTPADLDALLADALPPGSLVTPGDLLRACPGATSLKGAVQQAGGCAWPSLDELRGKFLAVLTGGGVTDPQSRLAVYVSGDGDFASRAAFVAPDLTSADQIDDHDNVLFYNMASDDRALAADVFAAGYVGRVWGVNDASTWYEAELAGAHHIATDKVNYHQDAWAVTHDTRGWPFACLDDCAGGVEMASIIGVEVDSGDIWDDADSFVLLQSPDEPAGPVSWTGYISTVNSHVEPWAKGCLMARAGTDAGAPYFAVCRPADEHKLRVQYRGQTGGSSTAVEADITASNTIAPESVMFVRMDLSADALCAFGYGSQDGQAWKLIAEQCFDAPLTVRGVAASSHDSGWVKFLFGNVTRETDSASEGFTAVDFGDPVSIGTGAMGRAFDGVTL